jgi:hypothetical protein
MIDVKTGDGGAENGRFSVSSTNGTGRVVVFSTISNFSDDLTAEAGSTA